MNTLDTVIHVYFVAAILFNVVSQFSLDVFGKKLASTDPMSGVSLMTVFYLIILSKSSIPPAAFTFLLLVWLYSITRFGIVKHLLNYHPDDYMSRSIWALAIGINVIGVCSLAILLVS